MARRHEHGFALLLVIWVLAILAVLAAGFAASTRSQTRLARNLLGAARARALAEAGISRATASLLQADPRARWRGDGTVYPLSLDGGTLRIRIEDEDGKIDLNEGSPELLGVLCAELAIEDATCSALVEGVLDRRRAAAPAEPPGVTGLRFGAPAPTPTQQDAAFTSVDELRQVPGLDAESFARLSPFLTVYAASERVDTAVAPREVLLAIPGVDPSAVENLLRARAETPPGIVPPPLPGSTAYAGPGQLHAATIIAEARLPDGARFVRRSVIELTGQPLAPVKVLEWRQDMAERKAE